MTNETDLDVQAALAGDKEALERLVERVEPLVYRLALRFFGNRADAEDASQEALIQIVTRLDRFSGRSAFTTWAYSVATRRFLSLARPGGPTFEEFDEELAHVPAPAAARSRRPTWMPSCSPRSCGSAARWRCFCASIPATGWPTSSA